MDMGQQDVRVDPAGLRAVAADVDAVALRVADVSRCPLNFGGAVAGRAHVADGEQWRRTVDALCGVSAQWARATAEIAAALRTGAARYADADRAAAATLG
jgi:uncharacterized protein YukE